MIDVHSTRFLLWMLDQEGQGKSLTELSDFALTDSTVSQRDLRAIVRRHLSAELIRTGGETLGSREPSSAVLTDEGADEARRIQERSGLRKFRAPASRDAVLDWLDQWNGPAEPDVEDVVGEPWSYFEGTPFTVDELRAASSYLAGKGLISGVPVAERDDLMRIKISDEGRDCIEHCEGSVSAFVQRHQTGSPVTFHNYGDNYGQQAAGETVNQQQNTSDSATLLALIGDLMERLEGLDSPEVARMKGLAEVIEGEVTSGEPDPQTIKSTGEHLKGLAARAGDSAFATSVGVVVAAALRFAGVS